MEKRALLIDATGYRSQLQRKARITTSRGAAPKVKAKDNTHTGDQFSTTISLAALLSGKRTDRQFRRLVRNLLTLARRVELARDYFGRGLNVTGPQYNLLMTVAELQGVAGVSVGSVAQAMHVSSSFVTAETVKLLDLGFLRKQANPSDRRGALLKLSPVGRRKIHRLLAEIRTVNDLFFGLLTAESFAAICAAAEALVEGSREAMQYIARTEERAENTL